MQIKYNLHDSLIESVVHDAINNNVIITIDLCNWLQSNYVEEEPENKIVHMIFEKIKQFDVRFEFYNFDSNEILEVIDIDDRTIKIVFMGKDDVDSIVISADNVKFDV